METIDLTPAWANLARFFANVLATNSSEAPRETVIEFIKVVSYLARTDTDALENIIKELEKGLINDC